MTQSRRPSPLQRRVLIVLAALDEKRPGPVLTRDLERVLERSGEAPVYGPNLRAVNATMFDRYLPFSCPLKYFRY